MRSGPDRHKSCPGVVGRNLFARTLLQWGWRQECQEQEGSQGLMFRAGKQQCSSRLLHPCSAGCRKGRGQLPVAAAWLGKRSSGTELGHRLLPSLPNEAVAWVSYICRLSSSQLRRLMAVCLSEEGWCFTELGMRTMGRIPSGHKQISSGARVTKRFNPPEDGP